MDSFGPSGNWKECGRLAVSRTRRNCRVPKPAISILRLYMGIKRSTAGRRSPDGRTPKLVTHSPDDSEVMSLDEAAEFLKCCTATLKRRAKLLHIPHKRIGSLWRFYRPALVAWMEEDRDFAA